MTNHRHIPWSLLSLPAIRPAVRLLLFRIYAAVRGSATNTAIVTVNGNPTWRLDDYFYGGDEADNATVALLKELEIIAAHSNHYSAVTGSVFIAKTPEAFTYDDDGNLLSDGRWQYIWNGENRLIKAVELIAPTNRQPYEVHYSYDHRGRMVWKSVAPTTGSPIKTIGYTWDDYNIITENVTSDSVTKTTYNIWGLDLSGSLQGAGGVGGLLGIVRDSESFTVSYDGNGNVTEYVGSDGTIAAHYEYSPFGEIVTQSGGLAPTFTHRFSTKPWCGVTRLSEYELRKYSPNMGRWMSRDPIGEIGFIIYREKTLVFHDRLQCSWSLLILLLQKGFSFYQIYEWMQLTELANYDLLLQDTVLFVMNDSTRLVDPLGTWEWWDKLVFKLKLIIGYTCPSPVGEAAAVLECVPGVIDVAKIGALKKDLEKALMSGNPVLIEQADKALKDYVSKAAQSAEDCAKEKCCK